MLRVTIQRLTCDVLCSVQSGISPLVRITLLCQWVNNQLRLALVCTHSSDVRLALMQIYVGSNTLFIFKAFKLRQLNGYRKILLQFLNNYYITIYC